MACCLVRDCPSGLRLKPDIGCTGRSSESENFLKDLSDEHAENLRLLGTVPLFHDLPDVDYAGLSKICKRTKLQAGGVLIAEGTSMPGFFLVVYGAAALQPADGESFQISAGDFFGEEALFHAVPSCITVTAISSLQVLKITRADFREQGLDAKSTMPAPRGGSSKGDALSAWTPSAAASPSFASHVSDFSSANRSDNDLHEPIKRRDLVSIGLLGIGSFGFVELVEHRPTGSTYALKTISKGILQKRALRGPRTERAIMRLVNSRFIIKLYASFSTSQLTYLLLEPALGGELWAVFHKRRLFRQAAPAKYYSACVVFAFEYLHARRIVYRDLKLENVLLDARGQAKLCDFGFAKFVVGKTYSTVGTPEYFAPEMIKGTGHSCSLDWWALGVFIFEMLAGFSPFAAPDAPRIYRSVLAGVEHLWFPPTCQGLAKDLLKRLFVAEPSERLPVLRPAGLLNLVQHTWYTGLDWDALGSGLLRPPIEPVIEDNHDCQNFMSSTVNKPEMLEYISSGNGEVSDSDRESDDPSSLSPRGAPAS